MVIRNYFKDVNINDYINPNETVAKGAAIQAAKLINKKNNNLKNIILLDIVPFSLGTNIFNFSKDPEIKQKGSLMNVMINSL